MILEFFVRTNFSLLQFWDLIGLRQFSGIVVLIVVPLIVEVGWMVRLSIIVCIEIVSLCLEFRNSTYSIILSLESIPGIA